LGEKEERAKERVREKGRKRENGKIREWGNDERKMLF
jgi:hypothetical protein